MNNHKNTERNQKMAKLFKKLREMETMWQNHRVQLSSLLFPSTKNNVNFIYYRRTEFFVRLFSFLLNLSLLCCIN